MDIKIETQKKQTAIPSGVKFFACIAMIYNCLMCLCLCSIAWAKDWWAALLLIPFCVLTPSYKSYKDNEEGKEDE